MMKTFVFRLVTSALVLAVLVFLLIATEHDNPSAENRPAVESTAAPSNSDEALMKGLKID